MVARIKLKKREPKTEPIKSDSEYLTIAISNKWRLEYDGLQFLVQEKVAGRKLTRWKVHAYIRDLDTAIIWLARHRIYVHPGVFDGRALIHICKMLDELKAECKQAYERALLQKSTIDRR